MSLLLGLTFLGGYITVPEVLWTLFGAYGMYRTRKNLKYAMLRRRVAIGMAHRPGLNGDLLILANEKVRIQLGLFFYSLINFAVGVGAMMLPAVSSTQKVTPTSVLVTVGLFLGQAIVIAISEIIYRTDLELAGEGN